MTATKPRIKLPESAKIGDVIEVKTLVTHVMETGHRKDKDGNPIARDIINTFIATFGDKEVFRAELGPGISANPYISFQMRVPGPGTFEFAWIDDSGTKTVELTTLNVI
ncbi:MAG: thiosulfate oxidation carrier complex protein SoxZ [Hyphomicrobium sp.]|nr:thiosulfate oxidation carrier complex protein SoxZ [Hyphomicrobium sp.]